MMGGKNDPPYQIQLDPLNGVTRAEIGGQVYTIEGTIVLEACADYYPPSLIIDIIVEILQTPSWVGDRDVLVCHDSVGFGRVQEVDLLAG
jgi:hypothetical protein